MAQYVKHVNLDFECMMAHCPQMMVDAQIINLATREEWLKFGKMADTITVSDPDKIKEARKYAPYAQNVVILNEKGGYIYDLSTKAPVSVPEYRPQRGGQVHVC